MNKKRIAIIYEGEKTEKQLIKNIGTCFFERLELVSIFFPAGQNLYMLWKQLMKDDFQTDVLEVLRDNLPQEQEKCYRRCWIKHEEIHDYKHMVSEIRDFQDFRKLSISNWKCLCVNSIRKLNCILKSKYATPKRTQFLSHMTQLDLYRVQNEQYVKAKRIPVISSIPLFLLEYFKEEFWKDMLGEGKETE